MPRFHQSWITFIQGPKKSRVTLDYETLKELGRLVSKHRSSIVFADDPKTNALEWWGGGGGEVRKVPFTKWWITHPLLLKTPCFFLLFSSLSYHLYSLNHLAEFSSSKTSTLTLTLCSHTFLKLKQKLISPFAKKFILPPVPSLSRGLDRLCSPP